MPAKILITGATGFIGRHLSRHLLARGADIRILARHGDRAESLFGNQLDIHLGDIRYYSGLETACRDVEVIYHVAGAYKFGRRHQRELWQANVTGTSNILKAAWRAGVAKVVHLSSASILAKRERFFSSSHPMLDQVGLPASPPRFCPYKNSKWHAERLVLEWSARGLPISIASVGCPIGAEDDAPTPTGQMIRDFLARAFPFYCRVGLNFIDVRDFSAGLLRVAQAGRSGERYLLGNKNLMLIEFLELLARETKYPVPRHRLPCSLILLAGLVGEGLDSLRPSGPSARVCLETALEAGCIQFFESEKARRELDWAPVYSIEESIQNAVDWLRDPCPKGALAAGSLAL